jgi:hypothetical protein
MQDSQVPTDPEDGATDARRRANLRLRDAEAVASVRRDMFGDGSLLDALATPPAAPEDSQGAPDLPSAAVQAEGEPPPPGTAGSDGQGDALAAPAPFSSMAQSLDAIIDSFPAEPAAGGPQPPAGDQAEAGNTAAPPIPAPDTQGNPSDPSPNTAARQMEISSLFDSLRIITPRAERARSPEAPPAPAEVDLDMSMLEVGRPVHTPPEGPDGGPPAGAAHDGSPLPPVHHSQASAPEFQPGSAGSVDEPPGAPTLDLDMSMLERPTARPVLQPEDDPSYADPSALAERGSPADDPRAGGIEPHEPRTAEPALPQGPTDASGGLDAHPRDVSFSDRMASTPFAEGSGAADREQYARPAELPDSPEPPRAEGGPPSFLEPLVTPAPSAPAQEPAHAPLYGDTMAAPSFRALVDPADDQGVPEPVVMPGYAEPAYPDPSEAAARPMFDAAAKIAAEAQATAEALSNLRRLLVHTAPDPQEPGEPPAYGSAAGQMRLDLHDNEPMPFPPGRRPALIPMPMPISAERGGFRGIYLLGFLTGLGLSLMAGIALYVLINVF